METNQEFSSVVQLPHFPGEYSTISRRNASANDDEATAETVGRINAIALKDCQSPQVLGATEQALSISKGLDHRSVCDAIYLWIATHVRFVQDDTILRSVLGLENERELLIHPAQLLSMRPPSGDCDCFTALTKSMLLAAQVPSEVVTIKSDRDEPWRYSHVYLQAQLEDGRMLVMDCSQGAQHGYPIGWEAPDYFHRQTWGITHPVQRKEQGMHGLGDVACDDLYQGCTMAGPVRPTGGISPGSGFDWNAIIQSSFKFASQLALKPGQYVQNAQGVMANQVPGATPGQYPSTAALNVGGIGTGTILIGVAGLALVLMLGKK